MFTTFSSNNTTSAASHSTEPAPRPKRNQVARACDCEIYPPLLPAYSIAYEKIGCRTNRIKCDDRVPCQNCQNRGGQCTHSRSKDAPSLAAANRCVNLDPPCLAHLPNCAILERSSTCHPGSKISRNRSRSTKPERLQHDHILHLSLRHL